MSVSQRTRVCLYAKRLDLAVQNLGGNTAAVRVFIQDSPSPLPTHNTLEVWTLGAPGGAFVDVPPFARTVRVDRNVLTASEGFYLLARRPPPSADPADPPSGFGVAAFSLNPVLHPGAVPVQGAATVQLQTTADARVVFELAL